MLGKLFRSIIGRERGHAAPLGNLPEKDKVSAVERLISDSSPRLEFFLMIIFSVLMATFGLLLNSPSVVIGSMLIAPLLSPVLGLSMGIVMADGKLISRSLTTVLKSIAVAIPSSALVTLVAVSMGVLGPDMNNEIISRLQPGMMSAAVAVIAGLAASFAMMKPQLSATLPGVAISVSLIPPLAVTGMGVARFDAHMVTASFVLFLINAASIVFSSMIIFSLTRLHTEQRVADKAIEKDVAEIEKENAA